MQNKKCTWSQHPKWFLERRADPANKDLTDLDISQQYTAENMAIVDDKPSYKGVYPDKIFVECWDRVIGDKAIVEEKKSEIMSWKYVFNSTVGDKWWSVIQNANDAAKECGYNFFTWNGWVYAVDGDQTGILVDDLF